MAGGIATAAPMVLAREKHRQTQWPEVIPRRPRGATRVVHMTDWHLIDERNALEGIGLALEHAASLGPAAMLNTGDMLTHGMSKPLDQARRDMARIQDAWARVEHLPTINAAGNHDIWGWDRAKSGATGDEPEYGKRWWSRTFGQGRRYRGENLGGWRVIALDSIQPNEGGGYIACLDDEQFDWLREELGALDPRTPVLILTHAPIICMAVLLIDAGIDPQRGYRLSRSGIFIDAWRMVHLFQQHPNVRLSLSGHMHMCDRVEFQGLTHICGGAVCGNWWRPSHLHRTRRPSDPEDMVRPMRAHPGYGLLDLHPDGRFDYQYVRYPLTFAG